MRLAVDSFDLAMPRVCLPTEPKCTTTSLCPTAPKSQVPRPRMVGPRAPLLLGSRWSPLSAWCLVRDVQGPVAPISTTSEAPAAHPQLPIARTQAAQRQEPKAPRLSLRPPHGARGSTCRTPSEAASGPVSPFGTASSPSPACLCPSMPARSLFLFPEIPPGGQPRAPLVIRHWSHAGAASSKSMQCGSLI